MGYYSEVAVTCYESDFKQYITSHPEDAMMKLANLHRYSDDILILHWESIKWNSDIPMVNSVMNWLNTVPHRIVRLGETVGDVEEYSQDDDDDALSGAAEPVQSIAINADIPLLLDEYIATEGISSSGT